MTTPPTLLVVDDEPGMIRVVETFARKAGFEVITRSSGRETLQDLPRLKADVAMVDLRMPEVGGLDVLRAIREADPNCQVILMTGHATIDTAIDAIKMGARDYVSKPLELARITSLLRSVGDEIERRRAVLASEQDVAEHLQFCGMIGRSPMMQELFGLIRRFAPHARTALITGETGTGKELVARALHTVGPRASRKFVTINCSAVVDTLFESELFGHARGAFTGATDHKPGMFEVADGGSLFLDEIGELPMAAQAKLLRTLETGEVQRVGGLDTRKVDVRVVAATNRNLLAEIDAGRFRSDLYYRLNIVELHLSPLRERKEDIPYLTAAFVRECARRINKPILGPTPAAEHVLSSERWPGNVRELRNVVERACILAEGRFFTERELALALSPANRDGRDGRVPASQPRPRVEEGPVPIADDRPTLASAERDHIRRVLENTGGNKKAAADMLGLSRRALYRRLDRLGLR